MEVIKVTKEYFETEDEKIIKELKNGKSITSL